MQSELTYRKYASHYSDKVAAHLKPDHLLGQTLNKSLTFIKKNLEGSSFFCCEQQGNENCDILVPPGGYNVAL